MSYSIAYDPELGSRYPAKQKRIRKPKLKIILILFLVCITIFTAIQYNLVYYVIPGEPEVTINAVTGMLENIRAGKPVVEVVHCFMETVLDGGK